MGGQRCRPAADARGGRPQAREREAALAAAAAAARAEAARAARAYAPLAEELAPVRAARRPP